MAKIRWLHLTDLHQGMTSQGWLWPNIKEEFLSDLTVQYNEGGAWDLVFFTGDLTQRGAVNEFAGFDSTIGSVLDHISKISGVKPVLVAVPGNHDLSRPKPQKAAVKLLSSWENHPEIHDDFWKPRTNEYRKVVETAFSNYAKWWERNTPILHEYKRGLLPGDFSCVFKKDNLRLGIVGLNSAFLQLTDDDWDHRLALSPQQLQAVCGDDAPTWAAKCDMCLLVTHHPDTWLSDQSKESFRTEIAPPGRFLIHLFGHMHESATRTLAEGGSSPRRSWQGPSLFGLETFMNGTRKVLQREHGYSVGEIDIQTTSGLLRLWPRKASKLQSGGYQFAPDSSFRLTPRNHTLPEQFAVRRRIADVVRPAPNTAKSLRVRLISTERDLGSIRIEVADVLKTTRGVEIVEGATDTADFLVLLLGRLWENGSVQEEWRQWPGPKYAFVSDVAGEEWPPPKFFEVENLEKVEDLRTSLNVHAFFNHPREVREKVVELVDHILSQRVGIETGVGLLDWERSYLKARMVVWTAGRSAGSHIHLHDAEARGELYTPELYIPLKATSAQWVVNESGKFCRRESKPGSQQKHIKFLGVDGTVPVELERWITRPDFPCVAVVGAPGGGKTVFLTRVAAELARARLGMPERLMTLDIEPLRTADGATPIPIVVEATRIAKRDPDGPRSIAQAMVDELRAAGVNESDEDVLLNGLKQGRYALLVDALDEIPRPAVRTRVLDNLKMLGAMHARVLLTTRSARYTGTLAFGPQFEVVDVAPLDRGQITLFCQHWGRHRKQEEPYLRALRTAVSHLDDRVEASANENALTGSPLMLTAVCMVYDKHHSLPDDRARLCELLVDDLCRSRKSEDPDRNWVLGPEQKRDLLQRIALRMQETGSQSWPESDAIDIAMKQIPVDEPTKDVRARRHLDWTADHTGLLRFQQTEHGTEDVRFWHRLFREYLAASRLVLQDTTTDVLVGQLRDAGRLTDQFWEDVVRLLPRTLGVSERAQRLDALLREFAQRDSKHEGRLLGLAAAAIVESRDLFPNVHAADRAKEMASIFRERGRHWPPLDRLLFLEALGRIDPSGGDPRLTLDSWIEVALPAPNRSRKKERRRQRLGPLPTEAFLVSWCPVTVQQYRAFVDDPGHLDPRWWGKSPAETVKEAHPDDWHRQLFHPNWPVTSVSIEEAVAYCRWQSARRDDGMVLRLPNAREWNVIYAIARETRAQPSKNDRAGNVRDEGVGRCTPVGAFPNDDIHGIADLLGNVFQWGIEEPSDSVADVRRIYGTSHGFPHSRDFFFKDIVRIKSEMSRASMIGFRCVLVAQPPSLASGASGTEDGANIPHQVATIPHTD